MKIVSIVNQKGGVAKTTTVANLGACLAARGMKTLLIDLDPQANLTLGLRGEWSDLPYRLHDVLLAPEAAPLAGIIRQIGQTPLYMAPGHMEMARCEAMLMPLGGAAYRLRRALEDLPEFLQYDWVLIDCPPSLGTLTQNAIVASTHLLIPTEPKFYAFAGMDTLNKMIVGLTRDLRFQVRLLGVLLTMCDRGTNLSRTIASEIRERFGDKVFDTVIYKNIRLAESEVEGKPIIDFDRRAVGAQNYDALAEEVLYRACG
jgi:chromosome partitioning protein